MAPSPLVVKVGRADAELANVGVERIEVEAHRAQEVHRARLVACIAPEGYFGANGLRPSSGRLLHKVQPPAICPI